VSQERAEEEKKHRRRWLDPLWQLATALGLGTNAFGSRLKTSEEEEAEKKRRAERNKSDIEREREMAK
jgi:hypothetical protein